MKCVFIGSSSNALDKAMAVKGILTEIGVKAICWSEDEVFTLSNTTIDELLKATNKYNAGVFIFDKDDEVSVNDTEGEKRYIARDNVIAEAGMFIGALGKNAVALCLVKNVHKPSDFEGVTHLQYDLTRYGQMKEKLRNWLENEVEDFRLPKYDNNILMKSRGEIHSLYSIDDRLHITDGLYTKIHQIRIMNLAGNLIVNPEVGDMEHLYEMKDIKLSDSIEKILKETQAKVEMILIEPNNSNLRDIKSKIVNDAAGSVEDAVRSAVKSIYRKLSEDNIYKKASDSSKFRLYTMNVGMPFAIFNVEFLGDAKRFNHVKIDLYSSLISNEDERRSFVIWEREDKENYRFFVKNFDYIKNNESICKKNTLTALKKWIDKWQKNH